MLAVVSVLWQYDGDDDDAGCYNGSFAESETSFPLLAPIFAAAVFAVAVFAAACVVAVVGAAVVAERIYSIG